jgi:hypothetical protein
MAITEITTKVLVINTCLRPDLETQEIVYSGHGGGELIRWLLDAMEIEKVSLTVGPYENVEAKIKAWEKKQRKNRESKKRHSG